MGEVYFRKQGKRGEENSRKINECQSSKSKGDKQTELF